MRISVFLLLACILLPACVPLAVGGAAGGGYYVGKDERKFGVIVDDASITASINAQLVRAKNLSAIDINVDTYEGVVTLYGNVPSKEARKRAIGIAESTKGVKDVVSELEVVP